MNEVPEATRDSGSRPGVLARLKARYHALRSQRSSDAAGIQATMTPAHEIRGAELEADRELEAVLAEMTAHVLSQPEIYRPSKFWEFLNDRNRSQLNSKGLNNFKRTINQNYYNWMLSGTGDNQFRSVARKWAQEPTLEAFQVVLAEEADLEVQFQSNPLDDPTGREVYRLFLGMLWIYTRNSLPNGLTEALEEPVLGNPIRSWLNGRLISQDLSNSIRERNALLAPFETDMAKGRRLSIVELGAGYGRLGYVLLSSSPSDYTVVDIPPALHVSQWYLSSLFSSETVFKFRPWQDFSEIETDFRAARIRFLTPDQFARLPDSLFDIGIAISNLAEMTRAQSDMYIQLFSRTVSDAVYIKQWRDSKNDLDGVHYSARDFHMPPPWKIAFDEADAIQDLFQVTLWIR
jgi:putative sugar O-methyltransferase